MSSHWAVHVWFCSLSPLSGGHHSEHAKLLLPVTSFPSRRESVKPAQASLTRGIQVSTSHPYTPVRSKHSKEKCTGHWRI